MNVRKYVGHDVNVVVDGFYNPVIGKLERTGFGSYKVGNLTFSKKMVICIESSRDMSIKKAEDSIKSRIATARQSIQDIETGKSKGDIGWLRSYAEDLGSYLKAINAAKGGM